MKTFLMLLMAGLLLSCQEKSVDPTMEQARQKILSGAVAERDKAEREAKELAVENNDLRLKLSIVENRLKIANDSCELYKRMLDESNQEKLRKARQVLDELSGK